LDQGSRPHDPGARQLPVVLGAGRGREVLPRVRRRAARLVGVHGVRHGPRRRPLLPGVRAEGMTRGTTRPPAQGRALAVVGALLVAGLVGAAPVAVADDACRGASDGGGLPPGTHDVALTSALSGGGDVGPGGFTLTVDYAADVR